MNELAVNVFRSYEQHFRDLITEKNWSSSKSIKELLRLNKDEDWNFIWTALDIVGDSTEAIRHFLQFGLDGPTKYHNDGERDLRLYGVLNATYLQQQAIFNLYKFTNVPNPKEAKRQIDSLQIRDLRNKLGAHSNDFLRDRSSKNSEKIETFVPIRASLFNFKCDYLHSATLKKTSVKLDSFLNEHLEIMTDLFDQIYEKTIKTLYKSNQKKTAELTDKLQYLRLRRKGTIIIETNL